jgi:ABC-type arginine transport system ATPase subunit
VAEPIRWTQLHMFTQASREEILVAKPITTAANQIFMCLVIHSMVSAATVVFIPYTIKLGKIRKIVVLKLLDTRNTIAGMLLQQTLGLGLIDKPTAPLESERALAVKRILSQMAQQAQTAIIVVTHDEKIIPTFKRIYHIRDGKTVEEAGEGRSL